MTSRTGVVVARGLAALALVLAVLGPVDRASATWSIVAIDPATGLVGAAMASCVPASVLGDPDETLVPVVLVPGRAAAVAQGTIEPEAPVELRQLLVDGASPEQAIEELLAEDDQPSVRQYAVVVGATDDAPGGVATHSGDDAEAVVRVVTGDLVSVQGVLLGGPAVADDALAAYEAARAGGATLDRALADALLAGADAGGDRRCEPDQRALFAHLAVAEADDEPIRPSLLLTVTVDEEDGQNPVELLDAALEEGRTGWIDAGLRDPAGVPRNLVMVIGAALTVAAVLVLRRGMGRPSARR